MLVGRHGWSTDESYNSGRWRARLCGEHLVGGLVRDEKHHLERSSDQGVECGRLGRTAGLCQSWSAARE